MIAEPNRMDIGGLGMESWIGKVYFCSPSFDSFVCMYVCCL